MSDYSQRLQCSMSALSSMRVAEGDAESMLRKVTDLSIEAIEGCDHAGVSLRKASGFFTAAASDGFASGIDQIQYDVDAGPCLAAIREGVVVGVRSMLEEDRWPDFTEPAAQKGVLSSLSFPLVVDGDVIGALNLYSEALDAFAASSQEAAGQFAGQAVVAIANAQAHAKALAKIEQLSEALESRDVIGQAKGIIMAEQRVTADEAFDRLRKLSQRVNIKLREVAERVVAGVSTSRLDERAATAKERIVKNELAFRDHNERRQRLERDAVAEDELIPFVCECGDGDCIAVLNLTATEYEQIHDDRLHFAVVPGHIYPAYETLMDEADRYWLVRKPRAITERLENAHKVDHPSDDD
jgi:hypothetical protein